MSYFLMVSVSHHLLKRESTKLTIRWMKLDKVNLTSKFSSLGNYIFFFFNAGDTKQKAYLYRRRTFLNRGRFRKEEISFTKSKQYVSLTSLSYCSYNINSMH